MRSCAFIYLYFLLRVACSLFNRRVSSRICNKISKMHLVRACADKNYIRIIYMWTYSGIEQRGSKIFKKNGNSNFQFKKIMLLGVALTPRPIYFKIVCAWRRVKDAYIDSHHKLVSFVLKIFKNWMRSSPPPPLLINDLCVSRLWRPRVCHPRTSQLSIYLVLQDIYLHFTTYIYNIHNINNNNDNDLFTHLTQYNLLRTKALTALTINK